MRLWILSTLSAVSIAIFSGCGATPTPSEEPVIDTTLPKVKLTEHGTIIDMNAIAFEWKSISDPRVKGVYVYKSIPNSKDAKLPYYATVNNRYVTHFLDKNVEPNTKYSYVFKTYTDETESEGSLLKVVNSLPVLESVAWISSIQGMPRSAKVIWRPHTNQKVKTYVIERRTLEEENFEEIARVDGRLNAEYIDDDLNDNYTYKYRIRVVTYDNIVSTPSEIVKVVTKSLPKEVVNIIATKELPKKINIVWAKNKEKDFSHYNLYRSESVDGSYELLAKLKRDNYTDEIEEDGKNYFYRVSAVDIDGLESVHDKSSIQGTTLVRPSAPSLVEAKLAGDAIELAWSSNDPRAKSYFITKTYKKGWFEEVTDEIADIKAKKYKDTAIKPNMVYTYKIYALDSNSIKSESSIAVEVKSKEVAVEELPQETQEEAIQEVVAPTENTNIEVIESNPDLQLNEL